MTNREIMMRSATMTLAVALLIGALAAIGMRQALAQQGVALGDKIERTLTAKDSMWRLQYKKKVGDNTKQMWGYGQDSVTVSFFEKATPEEAAKGLLASVASFSRAEIRKVEGVGDEAYFITAPTDQHPERGEAAGVMLRKGNVLVYVNVRSHSNGIGVARLFAQHVTEQVSTN